VDIWEGEKDTFCVRVTDPIWQQAIRLIARHPADAATNGEE
jgi:hypothetical protein